MTACVSELVRGSRKPKPGAVSRSAVREAEDNPSALPHVSVFIPEVERKEKLGMTEGRSLPKKEEKHGRSKTNECPGYHRGTTSRKRTGGRESARAGSRSKAYCAWHTAAIYTLSLGPEREERDPPARVCTVSPGHSSPEQSPWYSIVQVLTHLPAFPSIPLPPGALSPRALLSLATCSS